MRVVFSRQFGRWIVRTALPLALSGVLLALAPFAVALEVHHELAAVDLDGHQHSDTDLCQWVQHHTGSSLTADALVVHALREQVRQPHQIAQLLVSFQLHGSASPRAPPRS